MKSWFRWHWYYQITRRKQRIVPFIARHLPKRLKYFVIIDGLAYYTVQIDASAHPSEVTAWQLVEVFEKKPIKPDYVHEAGK